jgi:hydrogenase maturation protease
MDRWTGFDRVILIDATKSGAPPGTVHRLEASKEAIPTSFFNYSTHAFSVAEAVELARVLNRLPRQVLLFGIEGADFATGEVLSDAVNDSLDVVVDAVAAITKNVSNLVATRDF